MSVGTGDSSCGHHRREVLLRSLGVSVVDFRCRAGAEREGPEEPNPTHSIVFVRRGVFARSWRGETLIADPAHVLFFNEAEPYRYAHPLAGGDDCTILTVPSSLALEVVARHAPRDAEGPEVPFRVGHGLSSPETTRLQYELLGLIRLGAPGLPHEDVLAELLDESVRGAYRSGARAAGAPTRSPAARRRRRELVDQARLAINARLASPPGLAELAASLACSPFHLSRTFHQVVGLSLRRYVARLRARAAAECLARGAQDLTALALDWGYTDHSHFTNAFRREWGVPPSRVRGAPPHALASRPNRKGNAG